MFLSALLDRGQEAQHFAEMSSKWSFPEAWLSFGLVLLGLVTPRPSRDLMQAYVLVTSVQKGPSLFAAVMMDSLEILKR